jgi:hypothetical protein
MHNVFMKSLLLCVRMVFIMKFSLDGTSSCWHPQVPLGKIYLDPFLGKKFKVCEMTRLDFIMIDTKLTIISNPSRLHGWKEFATFKQGTIFLNSIHLYLIYFDPCHNLSESSFGFVFTCCTFVVHSCYKNDKF